MAINNNNNNVNHNGGFLPGIIKVDDTININNYCILLYTYFIMY